MTKALRVTVLPILWVACWFALPFIAYNRTL